MSYKKVENNVDAKRKDLEKMSYKKVENNVDAKRKDLEKMSTDELKYLQRKMCVGESYTRKCLIEQILRASS